MTPELKARFDEEIRSHQIVLYMKGNALFPQCGFSARALELVRMNGGSDVYTVDVLAEPDVRNGIKEYTQWPTVPQVFIHGKFIGGSDILIELHERGELADLIAGKTIP